MHMHGEKVNSISGQTDSVAWSDRSRLSVEVVCVRLVGVVRLQDHGFDTIQSQYMHRSGN